jgi:hypothetical protein
MKLLVIGDFSWDNGSSHVIREYVKCAPALGMEIAVSSEFGSHDKAITGELPYSSELSWATHILIVFESNPFLSTKDLERLDTFVPRSRRAVVDADGHWAPLTSVKDDDNAWPCGQKAWRAQMEAAGDLILQPTNARANLGTVQFPYFGIPSLASSAAEPANDNRIDVQYIGSNWFRFQALTDVFVAVRAGLGQEATLRICGTFWDGSVRPGFEAATQANIETLNLLGVDVRPPVPFGQVVSRMGDAIVTPVLVRPVLSSLGLLTPRMFETVAARTIPVYSLVDRYIGELYQDGGDLCLGESPAEKFEEIFSNLARYRSTAEELRHRLKRLYSYPSVLRRLRDLLG